MASKSDSLAKKAFISVLKNNGYTTAKIVKQPADIVAWKNGEKFHFEIKSSHKELNEIAFGAGTLTEWNAAVNNKKNYFFVIAIIEKNDENIKFRIFTPSQFQEFSSIPPFKIFFNIRLNDIFKTDNITNVLDTELDITNITEIESDVKEMNNLKNQENNMSKNPRNKAIKLSKENIEKMILFYNELIDDQLQKDNKVA